MPSNNPNIFISPEITDNFTTLPAHVVEQFSYVALPQPTGYSDGSYLEYAHTLAGSDDLARHYGEVTAVYNIWATNAERGGRPHPVAVLSFKDNKMLASMGLLTARRNNRNPR